MTPRASPSGCRSRSAPETIDLDGRAFTLDITLQGVSPDYSTSTFSGTIDDPRR